MEIDDIPPEEVDPDAEAMRRFVDYNKKSTTGMHLRDTDKPTVVWVVKPIEYAPKQGEQAGKNLDCWLAVGSDIGPNLRGSYTNFRTDKDTAKRAERQQWAVEDGGVAVGLADPTPDVLDLVKPMRLSIVPATRRSVMKMKVPKAALPRGPGLMYVVGADATEGVFDQAYNKEADEAKQTNRPVALKHPCRETLEALQQEARAAASPEARASGVELVPVIPQGKEPKSMYFSITAKIVAIPDVPGAENPSFDALFPVLARAGMLAFPSRAMTLRDAIVPPKHRRDYPLVCIAIGEDIADRYLAATGKRWLQKCMLTPGAADSETSYTCFKQGTKTKEKSVAHRRGVLAKLDVAPVRRQAWDISVFKEEIAVLGMPDDAVNLLTVWKEYSRWLHTMNQVLVCVPSRKTLDRGDTKASWEGPDWDYGFNFDVLLPVFDLRGFIRNYGIPLRPVDAMVFMRAFTHAHGDAEAQLSHGRHGVVFMNPRSQVAMSLIPSQPVANGPLHAAVNPKSGDYRFYAVLPKSNGPVIRSVVRNLQQSYDQAVASLEAMAAEPVAEADKAKVAEAMKAARARMNVGFHVVNKYIKGEWSEHVPKDIQDALNAFACNANEGLLLFAVDTTFGGDDSAVRGLLEKIFPPVADVPDAVPEDDGPAYGKRGRDDVENDTAELAALAAAEAALAEPATKRAATE
jgi:hypothetical protein